MNTKMITAYKRAQKTIATIDKKMNRDKEALQITIHEITYNEYEPKIRALKNERDERIARLQEKAEALRKRDDAEIQLHCKTINAVERTLNLIRLVDTGIRENPIVEAYSYEGHSRTKVFYNPLSAEDGGIIVESPYLSMKAYIVKNKKPTNCYSLIVLTSSIFNGQKVMQDLRWGYSNGLNAIGTIRILKEGSDKDKLLAWYKKNGISQELKDFIECHKKVEQDYEEAKELILNPQWLQAYLEYMKDYYENHYSRGTETPEYKVILQRISKL